eukprot:TRINITY_DN68601_c0_g1_i1.p2 TRINITY_DN68601_c0_g1~~TRINITY_DN68601_c0_g1_i1.p2  ORF type:complete len:164 (+),score=48.77 TRINITY_DN68601_c0_g1_i1:1108-1599(+)
MLDNESCVKDQKGKTLIVVDCQAESKGHDVEHECTADGHALLADKVCRILMMRDTYQVGVALLTCPFLIHEAGQVEQLQRKLEKTPFERQLISSDCRKMGQFIVNMFTDKAASTAADGRQEEPVTAPTGSKINEEFSDIADELALSMAKMKKSKKPKSKKPKS